MKNRQKRNGIVFDLIEESDLIKLDSSFEDHKYYTKDLIFDLIGEYSIKFSKPCIWLTMNQRLVDNKKIFYKNFCWNLYKGISPPAFDNYKYSFTYLCGFPRKDKLHMLSKLFDHNLLDDSFWSCGSINFDCNLKLPALPKIIDYDKSKKYKKHCWQQINPSFFKYSRFSLVQETEMSTRSNRYTEKTYKCFWMKHPFVLAGNYEALKLLHHDGFKTFHPYIDESYDDIEDRDERISAIIKEVKILCNKTDIKWNEFMSKISSVLIHNYNHAKFLYNTLKDELA